MCAPARLWCDDRSLYFGKEINSASEARAIEGYNCGEENSSEEPGTY